MKISMLKKILSCLFVFTILLSSTTVYADDKDLSNMQAGGEPPPSQATLYSFDEFCDYMTKYREEYKKDKNFCTLEKDYPGTGDFYNKLDCMYFPKDIDINKINRIGLYGYDIYISIKKNDDENISLTWEFDRKTSSFDYYMEKLGDKDSIKDDMYADIMERYFKNYNKPKTYNQYLTLSESGALDIKKVSINGVPVISHAYIRNYSYDKKDTSDNADLKVTYGYQFKNFGYEFGVGSFNNRETGYKYCDLVKVPLTIKKDLSAGEACYEKCESLN